MRCTPLGARQRPRVAAKAFEQAQHVGRARFPQRALLALHVGQRARRSDPSLKIEPVLIGALVAILGRHREASAEGYGEATRIVPAQDAQRLDPLDHAHRGRAVETDRRAPRKRDHRRDAQAHRHPMGQ